MAENFLVNAELLLFGPDFDRLKQFSVTAAYMSKAVPTQRPDRVRAYLSGNCSEPADPATKGLILLLVSSGHGKAIMIVWRFR